MTEQLLPESTPILRRQNAMNHYQFKSVTKTYRIEDHVRCSQVIRFHSTFEEAMSELRNIYSNLNFERLYISFEISKIE